MWYDYVSAYICIGFIICLLNFMYRVYSNQVFSPSVERLIFGISLWPIVAIYLVFDVSMSVLDFIGDSDIWIKKKDRDE